MKENKHPQRVFFLLGVLVFFSSSLVLIAQELPTTFIISFSRTIQNDSKKDVLNGIAYYKSEPSFFCVEIKSPIEQKIFYSPRSTLIYYPLEQRALKIEYTSDQEIVMKNELLTLFLKDKGLEKSGYSISSIDFIDNGLLSTWIPPKNLSKTIGSLSVVTNTAEKIQLMLTKGVAGKKMQLTEYSEYLEKYPFVPRVSRTTLYSPDSLVELEISLYLEHIETPASLPDDVMRFSMPENTTVEVMEW